MKIQENLDPLLAPNYMAVVTRLKIMAGCNISETVYHKMAQSHKRPK